MSVPSVPSVPSHSEHALPPGHHPEDHVPHVTPLKVYFITWAALMVLTIITVAASYVNFGPWNVVIAVVIATIKALTVALLFMHLWFDHKFHAMIMGSSIIFLGIFVSFVMFDTEHRGHADSIEGERPASINSPWEASRADRATRTRYAHAAASASGASPASSAHAEPAHH